MALPRLGLPYSIYTDASKGQIGCALYQTDEEGIRKPIGFWSRTLTSSERNYSTPEQECLAVIYAVKICRPYLQGEHFTVHTDQASLRWLFSIADASGRLLRWRLRLCEFAFDIKYRKGSENHAADALSRIRTRNETTLYTDDEVPCLDINPEDLNLLLAEQESAPFDLPEYLYEENPEDPDEHVDEFVQAQALLLQASQRDMGSPLSAVTLDEIRREQAEDRWCQKVAMLIETKQARQYVINEDTGLLTRAADHGEQILIPRSLVPRILMLAHEPRTAGHPGARRMYLTLRRQYYWPRLTVDCYAYVKGCNECARSRIELDRKRKRLTLFPPEGPLTDVGIDLLGPFKTTPRGNQYLLVMCDKYSKIVRTAPLARTRAWDIAQAFVHQWVFAYGPPKRLISDNGPPFDSKFYQATCIALGIKNKPTTTYHPQTNGQTERFNRTILRSLRHFVSDNLDDWDLYSDALTYAYNTQVHSSTNLAPFDLVLSRSPPSLCTEPLPSLAGTSHLAARQRWLKRVQLLMRTHKKALTKAQERYKRNYDKTFDSNRRQPPGLKFYDQVFVRRDYAPAELGATTKLAPKADGPYDVVALRPDTAIVSIGDRWEVFAHDRLTTASRFPVHMFLRNIVTD